MSLFRAARNSVKACRSGVRSLSSRAHASVQRRPFTAAILTGGVVLGTFTGYTLMVPVNLDAPMGGKSQKTSKAAPAYVSYQEVQKHNTPESCWVIINGQVYDATSVLAWHPAGAAVILKNSGKDATKAFVPVHPPNTLSHLPPEAHIGPVDPATMPEDANEPSEEDIRIAKARESLPPPAAALNLRDIEEFAQKILTKTAWAYYRSVADDENTYFENFAAFKRFWFRPRVLNKVSEVSTTSAIMGLPSSLPIFIAPAALARLGHPDGEMNLVRAAGKEGILQSVSNNSSCSTEECMSVKLPGQSLIFQLYVNKDRPKTEVLLKRIEEQGFKAIMVTVDAAVPGKRELDQRTKEDFKDMPASNDPSGTSTGLGVAHAISGYQDPDVVWADIPWLKSLTKLPIIIKGIQCVEDAEKAFEHGAQGIVLSNHGGRELDFSPAPMTVLYELHQRRPDLLRDHHVFIDGGVRRGTDVLKALCLGARAVGLGRPFLYANGVWGEAGCRRVIQIMREEIETGMRLLGVTRLDQLTPELLRYVDRDPPTFASRL
ncbi:FMN-dependent dehydrogenase-domain-containing protein [Amylocystis lapponica]|nr:FMN-dependent dehydrogenase-domain-containing protein [Amylocystis lapponica]